MSFNVSGRLQGHGRQEILVLVRFPGSLAHPDHVSRLSWPCCRWDPCAPTRPHPHPAWTEPHVHNDAP